MVIAISFIISYIATSLAVRLIRRWGYHVPLYSHPQLVFMILYLDTRYFKYMWIYLQSTATIPNGHKKKQTSLNTAPIWHRERKTKLIGHTEIDRTCTHWSADDELCSYSVVSACDWKLPEKCWHSRLRPRGLTQPVWYTTVSLRASLADCRRCTPQYRKRQARYKRCKSMGVKKHPRKRNNAK